MNQGFSPTFCPLPWMHLSAHLDSTMRICCNTDGPGFVYDNEGKHFQLKDVSDVQQYFNLDYYRDIRQKMLKGDRPEQCRKCYEVEDHGGVSVRQGYLNQYRQNPQFIESVKTTNPLTGELAVRVQSLDFSLSNRCNLKCIMCSPAASYPIKSDYVKLGIEYDHDFTEGAKRNWEELTRLDHIIEQVAPSLEDFLTTGGEPFLSPQHLVILQRLVDTGHAAHVRLSYHTNCTVRNPRLLELWNSFKSVSVHFSIDAFGELNEYIRYGTKWTDVESNVKEILAHPKARCEVHTTVQALNVFDLPKLYEWITTFGDKLPQLPYHIWMDQPHWIRMDVLPPHVLQQALDQLEDYFSRTLIPHHRLWAADMIRSYVQRAMKDHRPESVAEFKQKIRAFESIRRTRPIEVIIPQFKSLF
jgi:MoaA/NifB/PqqE/SkfB family radical SAM enzyme